MTIQDLRKLAEAATEAPWAWESVGEKSNEFVIGTACKLDGTRLSGQIFDDDDMVDEALRGKTIGEGENFADADLIAASRNAILPLLDRVEALEKAAEPFRAAALRHKPFPGDGSIHIGAGLTVDDLHALRLALDKMGEPLV